MVTFPAYQKGPEFLPEKTHCSAHNLTDLETLARESWKRYSYQHFRERTNVIIIIGGGPAGFFGAITAKSLSSGQDVLLLERNPQVLRKVRISGGGRCNVTHQSLEPKQFASNYPRGGRELIGPFTRWSAADTRAWFEDRGVKLKTEDDGRVFPVSDSSATIIDCLLEASRQAKVVLRTGAGVGSLEKLQNKSEFLVILENGTELRAEKVLLTTGGAGGHHLAAALGHTIVEPVPSLFTFNIADPMLQGLAGVAVPRVAVRATGPGLPRKGLEQTGPLLITHWGVSGPAVLKLSSWGARVLHDCSYRFNLSVDWCPEFSVDQLTARLQEWSIAHGRKQVSSSCPVEIPRRLWSSLVDRSQIPTERVWAEAGRKMLARLSENLKGTTLEVNGKSTFKEEFVTCGGVSLAEVDFKTMESRICPGLYLAGELLDIDGVTGGFNFQGCWTTGRLAGEAMARLTD